MTDFEPLMALQTPSTNISYVAAVLALLHAASPLGIGYDPEQTTGNPISGVKFFYDESGSTGSSPIGAVDNQYSDEFLLVQMEGLFRGLIESQTAVETEFQLALYKNRSEMYVLF